VLSPHIWDKEILSNFHTQYKTEHHLDSQVGILGIASSIPSDKEKKPHQDEPLRPNEGSILTLISNAYPQLKSLEAKEQEMLHCGTSQFNDRK